MVRHGRRLIDPSYDGAVRYLLRPVALCLRYWPQLAACYLLGVLGRRGAIELAAWAGYDNDVWASLIMPLAGMARLGSYVAMFLVLRSGVGVLAREALFAHFQLLETAWDTVMWALRTVFGGAPVPLLWLAVAGIVYGVSATAGWRVTAQRVAGRGAASLFDRGAPTHNRLQTKWTRLPSRLREKVGEYLTLQLGKFKPITDSARVILQAGLVALSLYVLAYIGLAWLDMAGSFYRAQMGSGYLFRGMA